MRRALEFLEVWIAILILVVAWHPVAGAQARPVCPPDEGDFCTPPHLVRNQKVFLPTVATGETQEASTPEQKQYLPYRFYAPTILRQTTCITVRTVAAWSLYVHVQNTTNEDESYRRGPVTQGDDRLLFCGLDWQSNYRIRLQQQDGSPPPIWWQCDGPKVVNPPAFGNEDVTMRC